MRSGNEANSPIKLVATFLGFNGVGKTTLLYNILDMPIPASGVPSIADTSYLTTHTGDGREVHLHFRDTYVQEEYDRLRPLNYPGTDVFVLCFPAVSRNKSVFEDTIHQFWRSEILRCEFQNVPIILVKTKVDEVSSENMEHQVWQEAVDLSKSEVGWLFFLEVSVHCKAMVRELVVRMVIAGLKHQRSKVGSSKRERSCVLL